MVATSLRTPRAWRRVVLGALLLGACASMPVAITTAPVPARLTDLGRATPPSASSLIEVRAFQRVPGTIRIDDLLGATCVISNDTFTAQVATPGAVAAPTFGELSAPASYSCASGGETVTGLVSCGVRRGGEGGCEYGGLSAIFGRS